MKKSGDMNRTPVWRLYAVFLVLFALFATGLWKTWKLQVSENDFLQLQGDARTLRNDVIVANRGNILDRNGQPLAISTPVQSLWVNPKEILAQPEQWPVLGAALESIGIDSQVLRERVESNANREFLYVRRRMSPSEVEPVLARGFRGLYSQEEYKRYYPLGEVAAHIVGLTNADDVGQEGMELAYEDWLRGLPGSRQVLKDRLGRIISEVGINSVAEQGNDLKLSIDSRIQYLAYRALKEAVTMRRAKAGTATVIDVDTGEVLAIVNQPSYNPNNRASMTEGSMRNRAIVDLLEPGSTVKPFTVVAALESGLFDNRSIIDTNPGYIRVDRATIRDPLNYGLVDLEKIITKSSQVGAIKLGLAMGEEPMLDVLSRFGFGQMMNTSFPGESFAVLPGRSRWSQADIATMAYGYGFQVSPLQLAQAYLIFANDGMHKPVSLLADGGLATTEHRVISRDMNREIVSMMETVVDTDKAGTGVRAALSSYRVAGKTGTAWYYDVEKGGYDDENYISLFAGFAPVTDPKIVVVITIHEPMGVEYGGGQVSAPVFADIAEGALRLLNVPPDRTDSLSQELTMSPVGAGGGLLQ